MALTALPIDASLPGIVASLRARPSLVLASPPGTGKTTRVPRALLDAGFASNGEILVLEPRRLAARLAARRVADELGEQVGDRVGYQLRFEDVSSDKTRIRFLTEGILTRRLVSDPELRGVSTVILDELHERHLQADLALALTRRLQATTRPELRIVAMSATLDAGPVATFLDAEVVHAEGKRFDIAVEHLDRSDDRPLEKQVASAVRRLVNEGLDGDVLVFLPGGLEIRRATEACAAIAREADLIVLPLHGSLSPAEQDKAVRPNDRRKVILSTNVAESSVTIDGVALVVDSGLARIASTSPWSGLPTLKVMKVSRASAIQRAGRAGRTRPGRCLRLFTKGDFEARPQFESPEIERVDLAETALDLAALGVVDRASFAFFEPPPKASLAAAESLLSKLGAVDSRGAMTSIGKRMQRLPLHPRLARLAIEAHDRGGGREGATLAALLSERDAGIGRRRADALHRSDAIALLDRFETSPRDFDPQRSQLVRRARDQVERALGRAPSSKRITERDLEIAILTGYPDRVGRLRRPENATGRSGREIVFATGGAGALTDESAVDHVDLLVAVDVEEREDRGRTSKVQVRIASAIEADDLLELFTDRVRDETVARWNEPKERVEAVRELAYEGLVLETSKGGGDNAVIEEALYQRARAKGLNAFLDSDALEQLKARIGFVIKHAPDAGAEPLDEAHLDRALREACIGATSFAELRSSDLLSTLRGSLGSGVNKLDELAPTALTLPGGRKIKIHYPAGEAPWAESRLQDFFGMKETPKLARGRVPLLLHLLAPNQRAVQVTTDLAGFWSKHYPSIAKELRRKYPRHAWPEDPLTATPPAPRR